MKLFELRRIEDESGVSGTGTVAQGVIFDTGWCALMWLTEHRSITFYESIDDVIAIHGHLGNTAVMMVFDDKNLRGLLDNRAQDIAEGVWSSAEFANEGNAQYMRNERDRLCNVFNDVRIDGTYGVDG